MKRCIDSCGSSIVPYLAKKQVGSLCAINILPNEVLEFNFSDLNEECNLLI